MVNQIWNGIKQSQQKIHTQGRFNEDKQFWHIINRILFLSNVSCLNKKQNENEFLTSTSTHHQGRLFVGVKVESQHSLFFGIEHKLITFDWGGMWTNDLRIIVPARALCGRSPYFSFKGSEHYW